MTYDDIRLAREQAIADIDRADSAVFSAARLIAGRLRISSVDLNTLIELKRELQEFNAVTRKWKPRK